MSMYHPYRFFLRASLYLPVLMVVFLSTNAQYESLLGKTYAQRAPLLWKIGDSIHYSPDSTSAFRIADRLLHFAEAHGEVALAQEATLYKLCYPRKVTPEEWERGINSVQDLANQAAASGEKKVEAKARDVLAGFYWRGQENYERALEEYNHVHDLISTMADSSFPDKANMFYHIGQAYYYFRDYLTAIHYFNQVPEPAVKTNDFFQRYCYVQSMNTIAVAFQELGEVDSADHYLVTLYRFCASTQDSLWMAIVQGNMGYGAYVRGHYEQAIPLLKTCMTQGIRVGDLGLASGSMITLADIYLRQGHVSQAKVIALQAKDYVEQSGQYRRYKYLYPVLSKLYVALGNQDLAQRYMDSTVIASDSLNKQFSGLLVARAQQKNALVAEQTKLAAAEHESKLLLLKLYGLSALGLVLLAGGLYVYRSKRRQHQQEQAMKDLTLKEAAQELEHARVQLADFTRHIAEKNLLIEGLEEQFGHSRKLEELEQSIILTGKDWGRFKDLFEQVHPGYLQRLTEKLPGITPAEVRLMALARLNFSNKEMAVALGVTPQAIRVTWHRLRKKAGLQEEGSMEELASYI